MNDEAAYQAQEAGYPVIKGTQVIPLGTWELAEDVILHDNGDMVRDKQGKENFEYYTMFPAAAETYERISAAGLYQETAIDSITVTGYVLPYDNSRFELSLEERAVLWHLFASTKSAKNNPYSRSVGEEVAARK